MFTCLKKRHKKERCVLPLGVLCFSSFNDMHRLLNKKKIIQIHLGFFHIFYYKHVCCNFVARSNLNCVAEISKKKKNSDQSLSVTGYCLDLPSHPLHLINKWPSTKSTGSE